MSINFLSNSLILRFSYGVLNIHVVKIFSPENQLSAGNNSLVQIYIIGFQDGNTLHNIVQLE
jgi:hypothetical protein